MTIRAEFSPMPSLTKFWPASIRAGRIPIRLLSLVLLAFGSISAGVVRAQIAAQNMPQIAVRLSALPFADIAAADRALGADAPAYRALQEGRVDDAQNLLRATLAQSPADATAHQLLCRVFYAQDSADSAIHECELAVSYDPNGLQASEHQLWLGRAYGLKARHAGPLAGFSLARKVHSSFERAVQLNPANAGALSDLGEYYIAAPSIVGGGIDKAQALATRMMPQFPAAAHRLLGRIAEANRDPVTAESEFKQTIASQRSPDAHGSAAEAWIDLAHFYQAHNRPDDALSAVKSALAADRTHGPVLVDAAGILTAAHRAPDLAERCLRTYLASAGKSDAAPAFKVHLQLSRLLAARGDTADANKEVATAAALAPAFTRRDARPALGS
jgi:tetratricopeptide (TPR) repeat protein